MILELLDNLILDVSMKTSKFNHNDYEFEIPLIEKDKFNDELYEYYESKNKPETVYNYNGIDVIYDESFTEIRLVKK